MDGLELPTPRELDIVQLVAEGLGNREVSKKLNLGEHTVKNYLFHVFDKLGVPTRADLVLYCLQKLPGGSAADYQRQPPQKNPPQSPDLLLYLAVFRRFDQMF